MFYTGRKVVLQAVLPTVLWMVFGAELVHAQGRCAGRQQMGQSAMQARLYAGQGPQQAQLYALQRNAYLQSALQQYALQQYALQSQVNALQQAYFAQMGALGPAQALQLQLSALQQAALQQAYGQVPAQLQSAQGQPPVQGRPPAVPADDGP